MAPARLLRTSSPGWFHSLQFRFIILASVALLVSQLLLFQNKSQRRLKCISIIESSVSREGLGAFIRRNHLAVFLANRFNAQLSFPNISSSHGYQLHEFYSQCREPSDECTLNQREMVINRCPRGDCDCMWRETRQYFASYAQKCEVLGLRNDGLRTLEYSGCLRNVLQSYLSADKKPIKPYDVLHYRTGDLRNVVSDKAFTMEELYHLLTAICITSDRDVIVLTEGSPKIPKAKACRKRIVLAGNTTVHEAFNIMEHAKTISIGPSTFAIAMAEVARPERVVMLAHNIPFYDWIDCEKWTIVHKTVPIHFSSKKLMLETVQSEGMLVARSFRIKQQADSIRFRPEVPQRKWRSADFFKEEEANKEGPV